MNSIIITDIKPVSLKCNENMIHAIEKMKEDPQNKNIEVPTKHFLYAGCYVRTCLIRTGVYIASCMIKTPTVVIVDGDVVASDSEHKTRYKGYNVLRGAPYRRAFWFANKDTYITMFFATNAKTLADAEKEFTNEYEFLLKAEEI